MIEEQVSNILQSYGIQGKVKEVNESPLAKTIGIELALGQNLNKVQNLTKAISLYLKSPPSRCYFNNGRVYYEIPYTNRETIPMNTIKVEGEQSKLPFPLGVTVDGKNLSVELAELPHLLIAGETGSGKSVCMNVIIKSLLKNKYASLVLIDPKQVEFIEHKNKESVIALADSSDKASGILDQLVDKMDERYTEYKNMGVKNHAEYAKVKQKSYDKNPCKENMYENRIVCIIDELSDLMMVDKQGTESKIGRIAQLGRAAGIHLVVATQRPSAEVITGIIRSNMPSKIAFRVNKKGDSRIILDVNGAETLTGMGDGLYLNPRNNDVVRFQCAFA